jgi:NADH dehydrogenase/NADH:ubiquinone oxidoreductase subunit G
MKQGDKCKLIDKSALSSVSMGMHCGRIVTLEGRLTPGEIANRSSLDKYAHNEVWWVRLPDETSPCYVPWVCLEQIEEPLIPAYEAYEIGTSAQTITTKQTIKQKEQIDMYLHTVAIIETPAIIAQQGGEVSKLIVPSTEVMANDITSAVAQVAAMNAEKILALKERMSTIKVICKMIG